MNRSAPDFAGAHPGYDLDPSTKPFSVRVRSRRSATSPGIPPRRAGRAPPSGGRHAPRRSTGRSTGPCPCRGIWWCRTGRRCARSRRDRSPTPVSSTAISSDGLVHSGRHPQHPRAIDDRAHGVDRVHHQVRDDLLQLGAIDRDRRQSPDVRCAPRCPAPPPRCAPAPAPRAPARSRRGKPLPGLPS